MQFDLQRSQLNRTRDLLLTITYNFAVRVRRVMRFVIRPTEMGVRVLIVRDNEVVLVRHRGGIDPWSLPGGGVKSNETLEDAACREALEEAGCPIRIERLHGVFHTFKQRASNYTAVFVCIALADVQPPVGDLEIVDACFCPMHALMPGTDLGSRHRVEEYLRGETTISGEW